MINGGVSFWYASTAIPRRRAPLPGDAEADVCIVGGGFTGLWTAYYLKRARPDLEVVVLEREFAGYGASGRNGGWLSAAFNGSRPAMAKRHGEAAVIDLSRAMQETVDEVLAVCEAEGIAADQLKSGMLTVARNPAQAARLAADLPAVRRWLPGGDDDVIALSRDEVAARLHVEGALSGWWMPHAARVQPAKLVQGLAAAVERLGVRIYEQTAVRAIEPGRAVTVGGAAVRARHVLMCLEGFTAGIEGQKRTWLPLNSAMVATAPLDDATWARVGWTGAELLGDGAHAYMYAQRTADGRIALGGRGVPYRFGSKTDRDGETQQQTIDQLVGIVRDLFGPALADVPIEHAWCGVLGVPRDWSPTVALDPATGIGMAGGYVGNGVATTNLAGRTLRDLVLGEDTRLTRLPWVGKATRRWEPEPLRFIGSRLVYGLFRAADRREMERGSARTSRLAKVAMTLSGRHD